LGEGGDCAKRERPFSARHAKKFAILFFLIYNKMMCNFQEKKTRRQSGASHFRGTPKAGGPLETFANYVFHFFFAILFVGRGGSRERRRANISRASRCETMAGARFFSLLVCDVCLVLRSFGNYPNV
jgi:hypothetical protein